MRHLHYAVQKLPNIFLRPMDDRRDKQGFFSMDAAQCLLLVGIHDIDAILLRFFLGTFYSLFMSVLFQFFERATKLSGRNLYFVAFGSTRTLCMTNAYQSNFSCTGILLVFRTTPSYSHRRENLALNGDIIDRILWLYQFHFGVISLHETNNFGWVHAREAHVRFEFHPPQFALYVEEPGYPCLR